MRLVNTWKLLLPLLLLSSTLIWVITSTKSLAADLLVVVVKDTSGIASVHYREAKDCTSFLVFFKYNQDNDIPTIYEAPMLKGVVTDAYCVGPDERIRDAYGYTYKRLSK